MAGEPLERVFSISLSLFQCFPSLSFFPRQKAHVNHSSFIIEQPCIDNRWKSLIVALLPLSRSRFFFYFFYFIWFFCLKFITRINFKDFSSLNLEMQPKLCCVLHSPPISLFFFNKLFSLSFIFHYSNCESTNRKMLKAANVKWMLTSFLNAWRGYELTEKKPTEPTNERIAVK